MNIARDYGLVVIWEFRVRSGMEDQFEKIYDSQGEWAALFRTGEGFVRTELVRDLRNSQRYLTLDFWRSAEAYDRFRTSNRAGYEAIDSRCEQLTENEVEIGRFEVSS